MLRLVFLFAGMLSFHTLTAQSLSHQVIATSGSNVSQLSSTTGEVVIETFVSGSLTLTQGFQQGSINTTGIFNAAIHVVDYVLFPNPARDRINLHLTSPIYHRLNLSIVDIRGRKVAINQTLEIIGSAKTEIDISGLAAGDYYIYLLYADHQLAKSIQFRKIN